ncbi:hypothetical protein MAR_029175 [Mya arenaria]|uniref:Uncharacterized protein n=1 Tax=Mya arenaria TaxID=6604 RepID=A0ABY7DNB3_MYAAR|nr:hypothetical protein MAR_029175 [Mya arenaria]
MADPKFDPFWKELGTYFEEWSVVKERKSSSTSYLPLAISVEDLRKRVLQKLPDDTPAPSVSWIRLNFMPSNQLTSSAQHYTGKFDVKALVAGNQPSLQCLDHDFHLAGIVSSDCLNVDIPESPRDSSYKGTVHVSVKYKVFQPSSPLRHAAENHNIVLNNYTDDGVNFDKRILFRYTDGGPDHRTTFKSVKTACLLKFISLDLDMMVCVSTAPNQSYNNPAERKMLKKCGSDTCEYCTLNPLRVPKEVFDDLHFFPDPVPDGNDDNHYKKFQNARGYVKCYECGKRRVVYVAKKLSNLRNNNT